MTRADDAARLHLRELAERVATIAALPHQRATRHRWHEHNARRDPRPMLLVYPGPAWRECLPPTPATSADPLLNAWEQRLRMHCFHYHELGDDHVVEATLNVPWEVASTGWGIEPPPTPPDPALCYPVHPALAALREFTPPAPRLGPPPLQDPNLLDDLRPISFRLDRATSRRNLQRARELFDDLLTVRHHGTPCGSVGIAPHLLALRGQHQLLLDAEERPDWLYKLCDFIGKSLSRRLTSYERGDLLSLNNDAQPIGGGGLGCSDELPPPDADADTVRLADLWGSADSYPQPLTPALLEEYILPCTRPALERFGLASYPCTDADPRRLALMREIPNLRRVVLAPGCGIRHAIETLGDRFLLALHVDPQLVAAPHFDEELLRTILRETLQIASANGSCLELILHSPPTVHRQPWRLRRFVEIARETIDNVYS